MLHPRPPTGNAIMKWKNRRPAYRVYVTLNENKLKWFGKDVVAGDEGLLRTSMNTHTRVRTNTHATHCEKRSITNSQNHPVKMASWHTVGLDNTIKIDVPVRMFAW